MTTEDLKEVCTWSVKTRGACRNPEHPQRQDDTSWQATCKG